MGSTQVKALHSRKQRVDPEPVLSERLYNFSWNKYFPLLLNSNSVEIRVGSPSISLDFYKSHFNKIFNPNESVPLQKNNLDQKFRYYKEAGDFFEIYSHQKLIGIFIGTPVDWSTYYFRSVGLLPVYQNQKIVFQLYTYLLDALKKESIERVEIEICPTNHRKMHLCNKLQFTVSGFRTSDRWGALVQMTRYLSPAPENIFRKQFCFMG